jgi:competence protein ComEA
MARLGVIVVAAIAGLALVGMVLLLLDDRTGPPIVIEDPLADATVVVAIAGAVATPGVYPLPAGARLHDALAAAGGATADADLAQLNQARRLRDEERIVVPRLGSSEPVAASLSPVAAGTTAAAADAGAPLDLNRATAAELESLPEIGTTLAQRIVDYRTEHGPFRAIEELAKVDGISARMVEELRPLVTVGP